VLIVLALVVVAAMRGREKAQPGGAGAPSAGGPAHTQQAMERERVAQEQVIPGTR
jgi:hypothetical protein